MTAACLARAMHSLVLVLFALNRTYLLNNKTALDEIDAFTQAPRAFGRRVREIAAAPGATVEELDTAVQATAGLFRETAALAGELHRRRSLPG